jgi:hypothetical protein
LGLFLCICKVFKGFLIDFQDFFYILPINKKNGEIMKRNNLLVMALISTLALSANAQDEVPGKPSPVKVAQTAFAVSVPAAAPVAAVNNSAPAPTNTQPHPVAPAQVPSKNPVAVPVSDAPMTGQLNMGSSTENVATLDDKKEEKKVEEVGIDDRTRIDNEKIRGLFNLFSEAINKSDNTKFWTAVKDTIIVIGSQQELVTAKKNVNDYFPQVVGGANKFERTGFTIEPGSVVEISSSGDVAKVYGRGTEKYKLKNVEHNLPIRWNATVVKVNDEWKISSFHSGVNFSDNSVVNSFEEFGWKVGMAAGLLGTLLGFILGLVIMGVVKRK